MPNTRRHVLFDFQNNLIQFRTMPKKFQKKNIDQLISHSIGFFSTRRILTRCRKRGKKTSDVLRCRSLSHIYGTHNELRVYVYVSRFDMSNKPTMPTFDSTACLSNTQLRERSFESQNRSCILTCQRASLRIGRLQMYHKS